MEVAPVFQQPTGLVRKYFILSEGWRIGGGVYLWTSERTARDFSEQTIRPMLREKFHVDPTITYFETPVIVDNTSSRIESCVP